MMMMILMLSSKGEMLACPPISIIFARTEFPTEEIDVWLQQTSNKEKSIHQIVKREQVERGRLYTKHKRLLLFSFRKIRMYGGISIADRQLSGGEHLYISTDVLLSNMCTLPFARVIVAIQFISAAAATPVAHVSGDQCVTKLLFIQSAVAKTGIEEENKDLQTGGDIYTHI